MRTKPQTDLRKKIKVKTEGPIVFVLYVLFSNIKITHICVMFITYYSILYTLYILYTYIYVSCL